ncbi:MAG: DUF421 domain-containing protein [Verrucomicrobiota bacterium]|nr:DUF421 domain-containing protein [Verrucomicrobiota bacterium]
MFFSTWAALGRVLIVGVCAYAGLVLILRVSGKRTLSKMNAFDFVVTVALGSVLATTLLSRDVPLAEGLFALALLIGLQWLVAWLAVRSAAWRKLIKSEPRLLAWHGQLNEGALREERISRDGVDSALRSAGFSSLTEVEAVVLETDGSVSVVSSTTAAVAPDALTKVRGFQENA